MSRYTLTLLALGILPVLASGCGGNGAGSSVSENGRSLRTTLTANPQGACGASATFTYTVTNIGRSAILLGSSNAAVFDVEVDDATGKRVWDYGLANVVGAAQITLPPGQTQTFTVAWYSEDAQGVGLKPGTYMVKATPVPQTINGAAALPSQQTALAVATTSATVSASCDALFVPNMVGFGLTTTATSVPTGMFSALGPVTSFYPEIHDGYITMKSGISVEAGIAYLQADASIRFAEPNGITHGLGGTAGGSL